MTLQPVPGQPAPREFTPYRSPGPWAIGAEQNAEAEARLHSLDVRILEAHEQFASAVPRHSPQADAISYGTLRSEALTRKSELLQKGSSPTGQLDPDQICNDRLLQDLDSHQGTTLGELQDSARVCASRWKRLANAATAGALACALGTVLGLAATVTAAVPMATGALVAGGTIAAGLALTYLAPRMSLRAEQCRDFEFALEHRAETFDTTSGWNVPDFSAHPARVERDRLIRERNELVAHMHSAW